MRRLFTMLALGGAGLVLLLVALEVLLRLLSAAGGHRAGATATATAPAVAQRWAPHPFLPYAGRPEHTVDVIYDDGARERVTTNSYGFRTHEFAADKQARDFHILTFGDAATYGIRAATNAQTWPELLERMLAERYPERTVRVFNLGLDMASSAFSVVNMALVGAHLRPDLVIVLHGADDLAALAEHGYRPDHAHFYRDIDPRELRSAWWEVSSLARLVRGRLGGGADLAKLARHPSRPRSESLRDIDTVLRNLVSIRAVAAGRSAQALFATYPFCDAGTTPAAGLFNDALRVFFHDRGFDFVDQDALIPEVDERLSAEGCLVSQDIRERLARNFFDHVVAREWVDAR